MQLNCLPVGWRRSGTRVRILVADGQVGRPDSGRLWLSVVGQFLSLATGSFADHGPVWCWLYCRRARPPHGWREGSNLSWPADGPEAGSPARRCCWACRSPATRSTMPLGVNRSVTQQRGCPTKQASASQYGARIGHRRLCVFTLGCGGPEPPRGRVGQSRMQGRGMSVDSYESRRIALRRSLRQ